jgi:hypothetical protein
MSDDAKTLAEALRGIARDMLIYEGDCREVDSLNKAASELERLNAEVATIADNLGYQLAQLERLRADNAALRAENERLTPFADAADTADAMNKHKILGMTWRVGALSLVGNGINGINGTPESACYSLAAGKHCVSQIEDRDAGPTAAQEPAKGGA